MNCPDMVTKRMSKEYLPNPRASTKSHIPNSSTAKLKTLATRNSLNSFARTAAAKLFDRKTKSLFVIYAKRTEMIQAMALLMRYIFLPKTILNIPKATKFTNVVSTPKTMYTISSLCFCIILFVFFIVCIQISLHNIDWAVFHLNVHPCEILADDSQKEKL